MLIKLPRRHLGDVVVGGNIAALLYSYDNKLPLIINKILKPHRFLEINGQNALDLWGDKYYSLSMSGLNLLGSKAQSVRIGECDISITTKDARVIKYSYEKAILFDDENVSGLPTPIKQNENFIVLDWINAISCQSHDIDYLKFKDNLVREIYFYPSDRLDGFHPNRKDLVVISHLNSEQIENFEYSDTYVKFKVADILKNRGIGGRKCGGNNQYALKLEVVKREIKKASMHTYENTKMLEFR